MCSSFGERRRSGSRPRNSSTRVRSSSSRYQGLDRSFAAEMDSPRSSGLSSQTLWPRTSRTSTTTGSPPVAAAWISAVVPGGNQRSESASKQ